MTLPALDDAPRDAEAIALDAEDPVLVCDECGGLADELVDGLGNCCRCVSCGSVNAPIVHLEHRHCRHCAHENGWVPPLFMEAAE